MSEWTDLVVVKIVEWLIPFGLGLLVRKRVGRFLIKIKRKLFNDAVTFKIISVRSYNPVETHDFNLNVYEDVRARITNPRLHDIFPDGIRIEIPTFGILNLSMNRISEQEEEENREEAIESIKLTLQPESPVRLGTRDIRLLNHYAQSAEVLFSAVERLFVTHSAIRQNYTVLEFPRLGRFVEEKAFEIEDEELGTRVHATQNKLTLTVSPTSQMTKATSKYFLV